MVRFDSYYDVDMNFHNISDLSIIIMSVSSMTNLVSFFLRSAEFVNKQIGSAKINGDEL